MNNKKGLSVVMSVMMMVLVAAVTGSALMFWFQSFQSEFQIKQQLEGDERDLEILGVQYINAQRALLGIKNNGAGYHIVDRIEVNGQDCEVVGSNVVEAVSNIYVDCPTILDENYNVEVFSDQGVSTRTFTSFEVGTNLLQNFAPTNLTVIFRNAVACQPWETKLYAMSFITRGHAEIPSQSNYAYSVCLNHSVYTLGGSCDSSPSTVSSKLFDLGATTNSHLYLDNTSAATRSPGYYDWNPVCLSATGANITIDFQSTTSSLSSTHACVGSLIGSNPAGYTLGDCNAYSTKMWLRVE